MIVLRDTNRYRLRRNRILVARPLSALVGLNGPDQLHLRPPPHPYPGVLI